MHAAFPHAAPVFLTVIRSYQNCICCKKRGSVQLKTCEGTDFRVGFLWLCVLTLEKTTIPFMQNKCKYFLEMGAILIVINLSTVLFSGDNKGREKERERERERESKDPSFESHLRSRA